MLVSTPRVRVFLARSAIAVLVLAAAWASLGALAFAEADGPRLGLLPLSPGAGTVVVFATAAVLALLARGASPRALSLLVLVLLPWAPVRLPTALCIWSGPMTLLVWVAVFALLLVDARWPGGWPRALQLTGDARQAPVAAGVVTLAIGAASAWQAAPSFPAGDEPHYLVITQSLWRDGDLRIENNHRRGDYRTFHPEDLAPHFQRRARDGQVYSIHAPGLPAVVLPAFALGGRAGVMVLLVVLASIGAALAWWLAWRATGSVSAAWFGWGATTLPITAVFHSFTVYPDGPGGVIALTGAWALLRAEGQQRTGGTSFRPWLLHGAALALLPWLHSRFAVIAGAFGALVLLRLAKTRKPMTHSVAFLSVPVLSAGCWLGYFAVLYGSMDPSAPYAAGEVGSARWIPGGLAGLLFDQRFGLLPYAPVLAFAFAGLVLMVRRSATRRLAFELLVVLLPYLIVVTRFAMWWGGWSAPARFFAPVLPLLAVPAAQFWAQARSDIPRAAAAGALLFTMCATALVVSVDGGRLAYNVRHAPAGWLQWLSPGLALPQALPWWTRGDDAQLFRDVAIWLGACGAALLLASAGRRRAHLTPPAARLVLCWSLATAVMGACASVWAFRGADGRSVAGGQLRFLAAVAQHPRSLALRIDGPALETTSLLPRQLRIHLTAPAAAGAADAPGALPMFHVPRLPAGEYRLTLTGEDPLGWVRVGIGRDRPARLRSAASVQPIDLRFPIAVRALAVYGDQDARRTVRGLTLEPRGVMPPGRWGGELAERAARYEGVTVYFLDDGTFPEPDAFWVRGRRRATVVVQPDDTRPTVAVRLRNGAVANRVRVEIAGTGHDLTLAPGEERRLSIPIDGSRGAALVTLASDIGFRPSDHDPASRDTRDLGVWVHVNAPRAAHRD